MMFRGREIAFTEIGASLMDEIKNELVNECILIKSPGSKTQHGDDSFTQKKQ